MRKSILRVLATTMVLALMLLAAGCGASNNATQNNGNGSANQSTDSQNTNNQQDNQGTEETDKFKVALLLPGSASDKSWNQIGYDALMGALEQIGEDKMEVAYSENVTSIDLQQALRDYASKGYDVIFGHTGAFEDDMVKVGPEFPDTEFVVVCGAFGGEEGSNVTAIDTVACQQGYSYGYLAGKLSKNNKVGMIGALEGVQAMTNVMGGFREGAKAANPDCEVTLVYVKDNNDIAEGREAASALAATGCDVIFHELNAASGGVVEVCKEKNILTVCRNAQDCEYAADQVVTRFAHSYVPKYVEAIKLAMEDKLNGGAYLFGYQNDPAGFEWIYDVTGDEFNPNLVSEELKQDFQENVVEMFKKDPIKNYALEEGAPGTY